MPYKKIVEPISLIKQLLYFQYNWNELEGHTHTHRHTTDISMAVGISKINDFTKVC